MLHWPDLQLQPINLWSLPNNYGVMMGIYKQEYMSGFGYVVYRDSFPPDCPKEEGILVHKVAVFVCEDEAQNYCDYRNNLMRIHGTDSLVHNMSILTGE